MLFARALVLICFLAVASPTTALPPLTYSAREISATIADSASGQTLAGAVVVAQWVLRVESGDGPRLQVSEAITDAHGRFVIPGWGPRLHPPLSELHEKSPELVIFKCGYVPIRLHNAPKADFARLRALQHRPAAVINSAAGTYEGNPEDSVQESLWHGMTIRLEPFDGTPAQWLDRIHSASTSVRREDAKFVPRFYEALRAERMFFQPEAIRRLGDKFAYVFDDIDLRLGDSRSR